MYKNDPPVIFKQQLNAPIEKVWAAITEPIQMRQWFFKEINDFNPVVGFETVFTVNVEDRVYPHHWIIVEVIPNKKIVYGWSYDGYLGKGLVTFELAPSTNGTLLTLTNTVTVTYQENIPEFSRENCVMGWQYFIQQQLKEYIEKEIPS